MRQQSAKIGEGMEEDFKNEGAAAAPPAAIVQKELIANELIGKKFRAIDGWMAAGAGGNPP